MGVEWKPNVVAHAFSEKVYIVRPEDVKIGVRGSFPLRSVPPRVLSKGPSPTSASPTW